MANTYRVQVITNTFVPELGHNYQDAQYFDIPVDMTMGDFRAMHEPIVAAEEAKRIAARIEEKLNPPAPVEPTKEELQAAKDALVAQVAELDAKIAVAKVAVIAEEIVP